MEADIAVAHFALPSKSQVVHCSACFRLWKKQEDGQRVNGLQFLPYWPKLCHVVTPSGSKIRREYSVLQSLECAVREFFPRVSEHLFSKAVLWE